MITQLATCASPRVKLLEPGRTCWRIAHAHRLAVLIDADAYFSALHDALALAQRRVDVLAWDLDRRVELKRDGESGDDPVAFGAWLDELAKRRPDLQMRLLCWDAALVYALERRWLAERRWKLEGHSRVRFRADDSHPPGASHHEKVVVIDEQLAFVGGLDITSHRWDTPAHAPDDPRRRLPSGEPYPPFHDVQCLVDDEVAQQLGELARKRWERATGEAIGPLDRSGAECPWPDSVEPWLEDIPVAILRTMSGHGTSEAVSEIACFTELVLESAQRHVYIESMYLTADLVVRALRRILERERGPAITIVVSQQSDGWFEQQTMDARRGEVLANLQQADRHGRLGIYYPTLGQGKPSITVHSKVLVVDDAIARLGSSNMTNRSMALDTECDIAFEAAERRDAGEAIARLRRTLLAEHLGVDVAELAEAELAHGSVFDAVSALAGRDGRTLAPVASLPPPDLLLGGAAAKVADPLEPIDPHLVLAKLMEPEQRRRLPRRALALGTLIAVILVSGALWYLTDLGEAATAALKRLLWRAPESPLGVTFAVLAFGILTSLGIPVTVAIGACAVVLGPWLGFGVSIGGAALSSAIGYGLGRWLGSDLIQRLPFKRARSITAALRKRGILSMLVVRVVPVAPFALINLLAGACKVRLRDYGLATALGMTPGIVGLSVLMDRIVAALRDPDPLSIALLAVTLLATVTVLGLFARWARRRGRDSFTSLPPGR